jgi:hypothetical protein
MDIPGCAALYKKLVCNPVKRTFQSTNTSTRENQKFPWGRRSIIREEASGPVNGTGRTHTEEVKKFSMQWSYEIICFIYDSRKQDKIQLLNRKHYLIIFMKLNNCTGKYLPS